jgi:hypothetical protein
MTVRVEDDSNVSARRNYRVALSALNGLPDHCAMDVGELAHRIGADKLELIQWLRADIEFARLIALKVIT